MTRAPRPVLVLGASGRLGRLLRSVWPADRPVRWHARRAMDGFRSCDILKDENQLRSLMAGVDTTISLAGVTTASARRTGAPFHENSQLALCCLQAAQEAGCKRVLLMSSAAVYGRAAGHLAETDQPVDVSAYGQSKLDMEDAALKSSQEGRVDVCCLRLGNVAGADAALGGWMPEAEMDCFVSGRTPQRSYIGISSLARVLLALADAQKLPHVLNIAAPQMVAMGDLLDAADLAWSPRPAPATAIEEVHLNTTALSEIFQFTSSETTPSAMVAQWRSALARSEAMVP